MAGNKKPRKPRTLRHALVPMTAGGADNIATRLHVGISAFIAEPSLTAARLSTRNLMIMTLAVDYQGAMNIKSRVDGAALAIKSALSAHEAIADRHDRMDGRWGMTELEAQTLRAAASLLDGELKRIPFNVWNAAEQEVDKLDAQLTGAHLERLSA